MTACLLGISQASMALDLTGIFPKVENEEDLLRTARVKIITIDGGSNEMIITDYDGTKTAIKLTNVIKAKAIYFIENPGKGIK